MHAVMTVAGQATFELPSAVHLESAERHFAGHLDKAGSRQLRRLPERVIDDRRAPPAREVPVR